MDIYIDEVMKYDGVGFVVVESCVLCQVEGRYGADIPKGVWHTIEAMEPDSVIFECKEGPFVPHEVEEILVLTKK